MTNDGSGWMAYDAGNIMFRVSLDSAFIAVCGDLSCDGLETFETCPSDCDDPLSTNEDNSLPLIFDISTAYPNPFNPSTTISFGLPAESHIEVSIFDLKGQHVETLINEYSQAGSYSVTWDASNVSSGVYFVHFNALNGNNTTSQIQKIMLVK